MGKDVVVVSLFDGLSGGRLALKNTKFNVLRYYSSEIDKYALAVANYNFPDDKPYRLGDVRNINGYKLKEEIKKEFGNVGILLIGGSPCTNISIIGTLNGFTCENKEEITSLDYYIDLKNKGFDFVGQSYLFWEYMRIKQEIEPTYWFLENVKMPNKWKEVLNTSLSTESVEINSALVSAQRRKRLYWCNWGVPLPEDKGIKFYNILEDIEFKELKPFLSKEYCGKRRVDMCNICTNDKSNTVTTRRTCPTQYLVNENKTMCRELTSNEIEELQTIPKDYTKYGVVGDNKVVISDNQRYKMVENSWTIDVISHILNQIKEK